MRRFITISLLLALSGALMPGATAQASKPGTPPDNLPDGSAYLDTNPRLAKIPYWVPGPGYRAYPFEEMNRRVPLAKASDGPDGVLLGPLPYPNPRLAKTPGWVPGSGHRVHFEERNGDALVTAAPRTQSPWATPIQLPVQASAAAVKRPSAIPFKRAVAQNSVRIEPALASMPGSLPKPVATSSLRPRPRPAASPMPKPRPAAHTTVRHHPRPAATPIQLP